MNPHSSNETPLDSLLDDVVDDMATQLCEGQSVDIDEYASKYPDIEQPLREAYSVLAGVHQFREEGQKALEDRASTDFDIPRELGDYRVIREIGRGGMGIVYEAEQVSLGRPVALKVLPYAAVLDQRQLRRFKNEARAAAMLKHPHIVSVYAVGCERGIHFYAMELVNGQSLAEIVGQLNRGARDATGNDNGKLHRIAHNSADNSSDCINALHSPETEPIGKITTSFSSNRNNFYRSIARMGIEAASALQYAHEEGVTHRDVKPSNLLLDRDGKLLVADFGLARTLGGDDLTSTGDRVGTLRYMSPEQITGDRVVDQRTDIYSLGLTLYEMIVCGPAFAGNDRHALGQQIIDGQIQPLTKLDRKVPRDLETIIQKSTAREADDRYMTASDMADDLHRFLELRPIKARRASRVHHVWRWSRRNRAVAVTSSLLLTMLIALAIAGPWVAVNQANLAAYRRCELYAAHMGKAWPGLRPQPNRSMACSQCSASILMFRLR